MAKKKKKNSAVQRRQENLKMEVAKDLNLADDLRRGADDLTVREAGKIGGNVTRRLVEKGKKALREEE